LLERTVEGELITMAQVYVQPLQTLSIAYPNPLTFRGAGGHTCLSALSTTGGQVEVDVNGFVN
jgi:hypothetical protein